MLIDLSPLKKHRDFRLLFTGQLVSGFGSMMTYVAVPYQVYELTHSSLIVGWLGAAQLVPLLLFGLVGGTYADALDRRKLLIVSELLLTCASLLLAINAFQEKPSVVLIFVATVFMFAVNGFHRPALEALTPRVVDLEDMTAIGALGSLRGSIAMVAGPALAGLCIGAFGLATTYAIDVVSFFVSMIALAAMHFRGKEDKAPEPGLRAIADALRYALARPELVGTYVVDIVAMAFAMPMALFPALAEGWGGATAAGALYSAMPAGALVLSLASGWAKDVQRHGAMVILAAFFWGVAIVGFGFAPGLWIGVVLLALAGAADMVSGLFRGRIWNETIPSELRGRLASVELISYMTGPLVGNMRAGWMASVMSNQISIVSGGAICMVLVLACIPLLPTFWRYRPAIKV